MTIRKLPGSQIESNTITITQIQTTAVTNIVTQAGPRVTSLVYPGNDTAGNTVGGQTVYINGSGFETNNAIYINGNAVPSKSFISASNLSFTTPALAAGIYPVYVINTDSGATAIFIPGYISSAEPTWVTGASLSDIASTDAWSISLSATGDAPVTYALAGGSSLPSGISLAANGLISGTMSSPPESETQYTFTVVASDAQNQDASRQFTVTVTTGEGVLFANNVLLIHADGTNNQNNHTFLDSSNNNFTITRYGNASQGTFSPFSQTGWSNYFDGTGDYLQVAENVAFNVSNQNFTIECWVNFSSVTGEKGIVSYFATDAQSRGWVLRLSNANSPAGLRFVISDNAGGNVILQSAWAPTVGVWYHVAVVRNSTTLTAYINGTSIGSTTINITATAAVAPLQIGISQTVASSDMNGYISNLRLVKGTALYTANFTPPTAPLTAVANTTLLTCQSNRFRDNSSNNFTITRNGDVSIQAFSPFAPTAVYSTANVGGSGYFDGTGDYLNAPSSIWTSLAGTSTSFTVEAWIYPTAISAQASEIIGINQSGQTSAVSFRLTTGYALTFGNWGSGYTSTTSADGVVRPYAWNHVAASKSGSTMRLFVNGTIVASQTISDGTLNSFSKQLEIGGRSDDNATKFIGYMSSLRVVQGEALYTANTSPPTAPPTNIANTSLLINFTNAGIFDQTAKNVLETAGDAKISTAEYKYGTGSIYLDGTGDYLIAPYNTFGDFGTGDFTVEFWMRASPAGTYVTVVGTQTIAGSSTAGIWRASNRFNSNNGIYFNYTTGSAFVDITFTTTNYNDNAWHHVAFARANGTLRAFVDGTQVGSNQSVTQNLSSGQRLAVGWNTQDSAFYTGYIDDLRITRGYARYTSNFTPPTSALKDK